MIESLILFLQVHVLPLGVLGVFLASVVEEVIAPIPSALIMTMSGFLLVSGEISLSSVGSLIFKVAIPAAFGVAIGSLFVYYIARYGGRVIIERWGKYVGLYWSDIEKIQNKFSNSKKDELIIMGARVLPFVPSVAISAFCGIIQMKVFKYFVISFIGVFFRGLILGFIGWQVGNVYSKYAKLIGIWESYFLYTIVILVIGFVMLKYKNRSRD